MTSLTIPLPADLRNYVQERSKARDRSPSAFVRQLIRDDQRRAKKGLEASLLEGLNSEPLVADAKFWSDLKKEALAGHRARQAQKKNKK
jgi:hypothetical protein